MFIILLKTQQPILYIQSFQSQQYTLLLSLFPPTNKKIKSGLIRQVWISMSIHEYKFSDYSPNGTLFLIHLLSPLFFKNIRNIFLASNIHHLFSFFFINIVIRFFGIQILIKLKMVNPVLLSMVLSLGLLFQFIFRFTVFPSNPFFLCQYP